MREKTKNIFQWYTTVLILSLFVLSLLCWFQFAKSTATSTTSYFQSNDVEKYCELIDQAIDNIDSQWHKSMFGKSCLSQFDSIFTYYTTGEIASTQVLFGNEGWLFYKSTTDGNPIADYEGTNRYTSNEMQTILQTALTTQEEFERRGIQFAILIAPNKENIYSEFMPDTYVHATDSSTDLLIEYLTNNGIHVISPKNELLNQHSSIQLYYSYDTHWNQLGAYIGVKSVLSSWNINIPDLAERTILSSELKNNYHYCGIDDLAKMVGLRLIFNDEMEYIVDGTSLMDWTSFENEQTNGEISHFINENAKIQATLLLVGDSFRSSMLPSLREVYRDVYVVHRSYYKTHMLESIKPDYLISEYVERYSRAMSAIDSLIK